MKFSEIESWSKAMDEAEDAMRDHLAPEIPELALGDSWRDPSGQLWQQVAIAYGATGGRWCYWSGNAVIVDTIFNGWSHRFAGMLRIPYDGHVHDSLMLVRETMEQDATRRPTKAGAEGKSVS